MAYNNSISVFVCMSVFVFDEVVNKKENLISFSFYCFIFFLPFFCK
jgi:hypothetical protein